ATGNVRIDRISTGLKIGDNGRAERVYFRASGAADPKRILDFVAAASKGRAKAETKKGPGGEEVTYVVGDEMCYAFLGNGELLLVGGPQEKNPADLLDEMLAVKAGKKKSAVEATFAAGLRQVPDNARTLFLGE